MPPAIVHRFRTLFGLMAYELEAYKFMLNSVTVNLLPLISINEFSVWGEKQCRFVNEALGLQLKSN